MIKRILILAVVRLLSAALSVGAASVTPSSASDYIFTTPLFPDSIRGEVMGDPLAYFDPRGEDIDWLFEAFMERLALINGRMWDTMTHTKPSFGEWPLSDTNNFYTWSTAVDAAGSTNIVVGYNLVTNAPRFSIGNQDVKLAYELFCEEFFGVNKLGYQTGQFSGYRNYYLGDAPLLAGLRVAHDYYDSPMFTNVNQSIITTIQTVTNVSYIVMPMTNGTSSVFTNRWTASITHLVTNSVTNVVAATPLDYCHTDNGAFPGFPNDLTPGQYYHRLDGDLSIMYDALRAAVRLAEETSTTNLVKYVYGSARSYENADGTTTVYPWSASTNLTQTAVYSISGDHTVWNYSWNEEKHEYDVYYSVFVSEYVTEAYEAIAPTRFKSDLVTTGGVVRVEIKAAFAFVEFEYTKHLQECTAPNYTNVLDVAIHKLVIVPLESHSLDITHKDALARVKIDAKAICQKASLACGAPNPPDSAAGYEPSQGESHRWSVECKGIVLIYKTHPSSKFSSW